MPKPNKIKPNPAVKTYKEMPELCELDENGIVDTHIVQYLQNNDGGITHIGVILTHVRVLIETYGLWHTDNETIRDTAVQCLQFAAMCEDLATSAPPSTFQLMEQLNKVMQCTALLIREFASITAEFELDL